MIYNDSMKNNRGFTLIELIVVVAIIAVLSISVSVGVQKNLAKAKQEEKINKIETIEKAARVFKKLSTYKSSETYELSDIISKGLLDEEILNYDFCDGSGVQNINFIDISGDSIKINDKFVSDILDDSFDWCTWQ